MRRMPNAAAHARRAAMALLLSSASACASEADRSARPDSPAGTLPATDVVGTPGGLASDGTLMIDVAPELQPALRAVADSFAAREAIRVELASPRDRTADTAPDATSADLIIVGGDALPLLTSDSTWWVLPFGEALPDSAAAGSADSVVLSRPRARRPIRRTTGRRADSLRADSARRAAAWDDSVRAARARADSARTMVLTIPAGAPNGAAAERFVRYLLSDGRPTLLRSGIRLLPRLEAHGAGVPLGIRSVIDTVVPGDTAGRLLPPPR